MINLIKNTVRNSGGTIPEDLPTPNRSLKELEYEIKIINRTEVKKL